MTDSEICGLLDAIEKKLPEDAVSARIALSLVLAEFARLQLERDRRPSAPVLRLFQGGA